MNDEFRKRKSLTETTPEEWESLCDGCALCCLQNIEDEDTGEVYFACRRLDTNTCRCTDYQARAERIANCLALAADKPELYRWLPASCAYRLLAEGLDLPEWHTLKTGDRDSVHKAGISVRGRANPRPTSGQLSGVSVSSFEWRSGWA